MKKIKYVIVEDDQRDAKFARQVVEKHFPNFIFSGGGIDISSGLEVINSQNPNLVILDINLKNGSGFDLLKNFQQRNFQVIFVTCYSKYAVEAFKFSALDYILKPYLENELVDCINRVLKVINREFDYLQLETFFHNFSEKKSENKRLVIRTNEAIHALEVNQIILIQSDNNYSTFFMNDGTKILSSRPLKEYDEKLSKSGFLRVHQSHLINLIFFKSYIKQDEMLLLSNNLKVPVSHRKKHALMAYLDAAFCN